MKFRTDFVTNSSDSSFLTFNIKNKQLFECLTGLGIKFENVKKGEFSDRMRIVLPSGESEIIDGGDNWSLPYYSDYASISAWLVAAILWEIEERYPPKEEEEYSDFSKELIQLLNDADIIHLDWDMVEEWSRDELNTDLEKKFGKMDESIEDARIEHTYGMEGEVGPALYTEIHNGERLTASYSNCLFSDVQTENASGLCFAITGELSIFRNRTELIKRIEDLGGSVTDDVTKNTDYVICNDIYSESVKMKKAKEQGVAVLSEMAFIRRFCDVSEFEEIDEDRLEADSWDLAYNGGVLNFVMKNGTQPIVMEIWKDGKWIKAISDQKAAAENSKVLAAENEARKLMASIFADDDGTLKKLLTIHSRDCLATEDEELLSKAANLSFDDLCDQGYLVFESGQIDADELKQDCIIAVRKDEQKSFLGGTETSFLFITICKSDISDLEGCKSRPVEISSVINELTNGRTVPDIGKIFFSSTMSRAISDVQYGYFLFCATDKTKTRKGKNLISGYDSNNNAVLHELFKDNRLFEAMEIEAMPVNDLYEKGYFRVTLSFDSEYESWIMVDWEFGFTNTLTISPVSKDKNKLKEISAIIIEILSGFKLPAKGTLKYKADDSRAEVDLSDELHAALLLFSK